MTPTRSLILHQHEIAADLRGELRLVVRPVAKSLGDFSFATVRLSSFHSLWGTDAWIFETLMDKEATGYEAISKGLRCPLGVPGTRLVGKETWAEAGDYVGWDSRQGERPEGVGVIAYRADDGLRQYSIMLKDPESFKASDLSGYDKLIWRSPATMPAWASRIALEVVSVGVCRLDGIYESEAEMTGVEPELVPPDGGGSPHKEGLRTFWNARYAAKGLGWDINPWCWKVAVKGVGK